MSCIASGEHARILIAFWLMVYIALLQPIFWQKQVEGFVKVCTYRIVT